MASAAAERMQLPPGTNTNWVPPEGGGGLALSTTDMNSLTATQLAGALVGSNPTISNASVTGANVALGTFAGGSGILFFDEGIILSSGNIASVIAGNPNSNVLNDTSTDNGTAGDADLTTIAGFDTHDAAILEFDFECTGTQAIQFQFQFTSEEYNEFVGSEFNDVFAFFVNGVNIAVVPALGTTPITVDSINCENPYNPLAGPFCSLYINNNCNDIPSAGAGSFPCNGPVELEQDGLTIELTASTIINNGLNSMEIKIADASDSIYDSAVFIKKESLVCEVATGACCNPSASSCESDVLAAECVGAGDEWHAGLSCLQAWPNVPATSGWGKLAIGGMMLLMGVTLLRSRASMQWTAAGIIVITMVGTAMLLSQSAPGETACADPDAIAALATPSTEQGA